MWAARDDLIVIRWTLGQDLTPGVINRAGETHIGSAALAPLPQAAHSQSLICSKASWLRMLKVSFGLLWKERSHLLLHSYKLSSAWLELLELVERMLTRRHYVCRKENFKIVFNEVDEILELIVGFQRFQEFSSLASLYSLPPLCPYPPLTTRKMFFFKIILLTETHYNI